MISWHRSESSHDTQWHFLPYSILCFALPSFFPLSGPHSWVSIQQKANITTLMQPFIFQLHPCFFVAAVRTVKIMDFLANGNGKNKLGRKRQGTEALVDLRETGAPESWGLGSLQIRRSVLPALPLRAEQKESCGGKAFILMQLCQRFHPRATDAQSPLWTSSQKTGFSAVMQTKSLITILGLSSRSHNYGTSYYAN